MIIFITGIKTGSEERKRKLNYSILTKQIIVTTLVYTYDKAI